jgi:hypothetical protein
MKIRLKTHGVIGACLLAGMPYVALADGPSNTAVGELDAILKFCAKTNPHLTADIESQLNRLTGAAPGARGTKEYKQGYDLVSDALANTDRESVASACSALEVSHGKP